jgi:hypothetical protein
MGQFNFPGFSFVNLMTLMLDFFGTSKADEDYATVEEAAQRAGHRTGA